MLRFKEFLAELAVTKRKGIIHLDKMRHYDFIELMQLVQKEYKGLISQKHLDITEKMDGCLAHDTKIDTIEFGETTIGNVVDNHSTDLVHVKSYDIYNDEIIYKKITEFSVKENIDNWYELELENGTILKVTGNHKVWMPELKCWREVEHLKENDVFLID